MKQPEQSCDFCISLWGVYCGVIGQFKGVFLNFHIIIGSLIIV